jgi:MSHA biogenesis protein MshL
MTMHRLTSPQKFAAAFGRGSNARAVAQTAMALLLCSALGSCGMMEKYNDFDLAGGSSKKDYENLEGRTAPVPQARGDEPPIPGFQSVLAAPSAPELADTRRVSIAVTETTPVRDILIELARKAQVDLEMDPRVSGGVIMTATDRPFIEVVGRIADLAELRYTYERNTLKVELDDPYLEQYKVDVINLKRDATSTAGSSSDAASAGQAVGGGGGAAGNKSSSSVSMTTSWDFWGTIGNNLDQIMAGIQSRRGTPASAITAAFVPEAEKPAPAPATAAPAAGGAGAGAAAPGGAAGVLGKAAALGARQQQLDATMAQDAAKPTDVAPAAKAADAPKAAVTNSRYTLNPQAGIITVFATHRQHKAIERYLRDVRNSVSQQVLIEAKVMEISLNDNYRGGIDWTAVLGPRSGLQNFNFSTAFGQGVPAELLNPTLSGNWTGAIIDRGKDALGNTVVRNDLSAAAQLVKQFGTTRTLSSPRLTVLNNQMAQLKVAQNQVFFELQVTVADSTPTAAGKTTVSSQIKTVPVGLILSVQPSVDAVTRQISLNLRPSITRITGFVNDPGVAVTIAVARQNNSNIPDITSPIPIIESREMDSIVTMESGQTVVMGGMMQEEVSTSRQGVPGLMDIPLLGQAASQNIKQNKVTELVVFIRATLANAPSTVMDEDIRLYRKFTPDPRPIAF